MLFTLEELKKEIADAEHELHDRGLRLWEKIRIAPERWAQEQYPGKDSFWVIGILGNQCLYFNEMEKGWGWGQYKQWGKITEYHWQQDEIQHSIYQTMFAIDNGGKG